MYLTEHLHSVFTQTRRAKVLPTFYSKGHCHDHRNMTCNLAERANHNSGDFCFQDTVSKLEEIRLILFQFPRTCTLTTKATDDCKQLQRSNIV